MYINIEVAIKFLYALIILNVGFAVVVYAMKIKKLRRTRMEHRFEVKIKDYLTYVLVHIEGKEPLNAPPFSLNQVEQEVMQEQLNDMIENFTGTARDKCMELCKRLGLVQVHLNRLEKGSYSVKVDAAYHLGCMRVQEAVPALLKFLQTHRRNSSLFVVARSIAKCARDERDVKEMVQIVLRHNKGFYDLLVDMIKEADIDHGVLFTEFIQRESHEFIHIGLCGLKDYTEPTVASAAYRLIGSPDRTIQSKAVEIYLKSVHFIPRNVVQKLLQNPLDEVRILTLQAIADLQLMTYIDVMRNALLDESMRVSEASAKGLLLLGERGIAELCEVAAEVRRSQQGEYLHMLIEEQIQSLSLQLHDLDQLTRYNSLVYYYEKTIGKNKRIYRVV
ncbi:HEAT repeat domain-containing protein [Cohnella sp. WQ 127256]|uniref:HEAT repeat domain-containing protein n=1 Tax=Cohnella sp. WQ 127256 TaxID=2938790 RepID=UPI002117E979|nr:HEAT repeat domain-containing protein [Cohnella sp. WQ 127256]